MGSRTRRAYGEAFFREIKAAVSAFGIEAIAMTVNDVVGLETAVTAISAKQDASVINYLIHSRQFIECSSTN
jgi:hypothetical protein